MKSDPEVQRALETYQLGLPACPPPDAPVSCSAGGSAVRSSFRSIASTSRGRHSAFGLGGLRPLGHPHGATVPRRNQPSHRRAVGRQPLDAGQWSAGAACSQSPCRQTVDHSLRPFGVAVGRATEIVRERRRPAVDLPLEQLHRLADWPFAGAGSLADQVNEGLVPLRRQSVRIVVSDFLFPHDPIPLVRRLASDASTLWIVQILSGFEADPISAGGKRLVDGETGAELDLVIDDVAIARYKQRLTRLQGALASACRQFHARYAIVTADAGLAAVCRSELCPAGCCGRSEGRTENRNGGEMEIRNASLDVLRAFLRVFGAAYPQNWI